MSSPITSPRFAPVPTVSPPAPVMPAKADSQAQPTDLLLITSSTDFPRTMELLSAEAASAGIRLDTICIEDLDGSNAGQKMTSLHRTIGEQLASGKLHRATAIYLALHGCATRTNADIDARLERQPGIREFIYSLEQDHAAAAAGSAGRTPAEQDADGDGTVSDADSEVGDDDGRVSNEDSESGSDDEKQVLHMMSACENALQFPSTLLLKAARHTALTTEGLRPDYQGTIFIGACDAGGMKEQLVGSGGDYVVLNGKKSGLSRDADHCMLEVIGMMAEARQKHWAPFSGRQYWMQLRNVSGEHIAYVGQAAPEIHKCLEAGQSEPVLVLRNSQAAGQPMRVLEAKLAHGSPKALGAVFKRYGTGLLDKVDATQCFSLLAMDTYRSRSELEEKIEIMERHGFSVPDDPDNMAEVLDEAIHFGNHALLTILLSRRTDDELSPALLQSVRKCLFEPTDQAKANARKLEALCREKSFLRLLVINWLQESVDTVKAAGMTGRFDMGVSPYFGHLLFSRRLSSLPRELGQSLEKYYPKISKEKLRSEALNTLAWEDLPAAWELAKRLVLELEANGKEKNEAFKKLIGLTPQIFPKKST